MFNSARDVTPLSAHRAFVICMGKNRVTKDRVTVEGDFVGRIEHVVSGRSISFVSLDELLVFINQVLTSQDALQKNQKPRELE